MKARRVSVIANLEQTQRVDTDLDGLLVALLARVEKNLRQVGPRLLLLRSCICDQHVEELIRMREIAGKVFAFQGFGMELVNELISALPGLVAQELESDGNVVEGILVRERMPRPAPRHKIQTRRTLLLLLIGNELPSIIQIAQGIGLRDEFLVGAEAVH